MCLCCCVNSDISNNLSEKQSKRLITYKLFILFVLSAMITSLAFVIRSRIDLNQSERIIAICVLCFAGIVSNIIDIELYL
jgi:heme/copper-type cytochrome/quinol oxidase subunit 4